MNDIALRELLREWYDRERESVVASFCNASQRGDEHRENVAWEHEDPDGFDLACRTLAALTAPAAPADTSGEPPRFSALATVVDGRCPNCGTPDPLSGEPPADAEVYESHQPWRVPDLVVPGEPPAAPRREADPGENAGPETAELRQREDAIAGASEGKASPGRGAPSAEKYPPPQPCDECGSQGYEWRVRNIGCSRCCPRGEWVGEPSTARTEPDATKDERDAEMVLLSIDNEGRLLETIRASGGGRMDAQWAESLRILLGVAGLTINHFRRALHEARSTPSPSTRPADD